MSSGSFKAAQQPGQVKTANKQESQLRHYVHLLVLNIYFWTSCCVLAVSQYVGMPLYVISRDSYYRWMAFVKRGIVLLILSIAQWFSTTKICEYGDQSVNGEIKRVDGGVEHKFPSRMVLIANHQLYNDWVYLWNTAYTNNPFRHGDLFLVLKDSIKYIPIVGFGLRLAGFVYMSRKMKTDLPRLTRRITQLKRPSPTGFNPMWLVMFPEGTNLSKNGRRKSAQWAEKKGFSDLRYQLLPHSAGTYMCLKALEGTVDWVYDCTLAYDDIPDGEYGQDVFTMWEMYIKRNSPAVHMFWRRFRISSIPLATLEDFDAWLQDQWLKKEGLLDEHARTGQFQSYQGECVTSEVRLRPAGVIWTLCGVPLLAISAAISIARLAT